MGNYAARVPTDENHWPCDRSMHLKEAHPTWCISPCPHKCTQGCLSCIAVGLLKDPIKNLAAPAGRSLLGNECSQGASSSSAVPPGSSTRKRPRDVTEEANGVEDGGSQHI